jgi:hypothetical protein
MVFTREQREPLSLEHTASKARNLAKLTHSNPRKKENLIVDAAVDRAYTNFVSL